MLPLQISFKMSEGRTYGKLCASVYVRGKDDLQVAVSEFDQLLSLVRRLIIHITLALSVLRAGLGGGTGPNSTERMDDNQEPLLHTLPLVGICGAVCFVEVMEHAHDVVSRNNRLLPG